MALKDETTTAVQGDSVETDVPARLDRLPWSAWHWMVLIGLGTVWVLDGLEVTIVGAVGSTLTKSGSGVRITTAQVGDAAAIYVAGACLGALVFGHLTDRLGRKRLFLVTLGVYLVATMLTATSRNAGMFFAFRFVTGMGVGGEYSAINSAIDELIPARVRGTVDLIVNGSYWLGTAAGAAATLVLLDPKILASDIGWRVCFLMGALLGLGVLFVRRKLPESPRWLFTHGRASEAELVVTDIENEVQESTNESLDPTHDTISIQQRPAISFVDVARVVFGRYPRRSVLGLSLFVGQAFLYNSVFFTYSLVLTTFYHVSSDSVGYYLIAFAAGNFLGPLLLGRLFDVLGRRTMVSTTYLLSGVMLIVTARLFDAGVLSAGTQTLAWAVIFFFASAGASSAYLTVSEIFPMETRALAIAFFYAVGTGLGGIVGPALFGNLVASKSTFQVAIGYVVGAVLMIGAGIVEVALGVDAEQKGLEEIATPLSAVAEQTEDTPSGDFGAGVVTRRASNDGARFRARPSQRSGWAPLQRASVVPREDRLLDSETERISGVLGETGPMTSLALARSVGARHWGPGRFRRAVRHGLATGRIRRIGRGRYEASNGGIP
jgi:MFS family permease